MAVATVAAVAAVGALALAPFAGPASGSAPRLAAQEPADTARAETDAAGRAGWDDPRALALVARARDRRRQPVVDSSLQNYRADVTGHIYFFLDRESEPEPVLLRADQVALELYWRQPDRVKQVIRGMRSEEQFPIKNFRYYLDRYTVIHNGFGDEIRVGEGRDVQDVPHPLAPGADTVYQYRLGDSTTIRLPGEDTPLRVYEIQVRPRDFDAPAMVGSLFVERARGDLVRLTFTFTPAAYLDPRNERVEIMLENALWEGSYWLPREQRILVRREIPQLDLDVGTVIRAALRVTDYELNLDIPRAFFFGSRVVAAAGPDGLAAYEFDEGLYDGYEAVGLAPGATPGTLDEVDVEAITGRILRQRYLRGLSRVRLFAPTASDALRYDRSEGWVTGAGLSVGVGISQLYAYGGYAWGSREPVAELGWRPAGPAGPEGRLRLFAEGYVNRPRDLGLRPAAAGAIATLAAAGLGQDFRDIHPATGGAVGVTAGNPRDGSWTVALVVEDHHAAEQAATEAPVGDDLAFRPVAPALEGRRQLVRVDHERRLPVGGLAGAAVAFRPGLEVGRWDPDAPAGDGGSGGGGAGEDPAAAGAETGGFGRVVVELDGSWTSEGLDAGVDGRLTAGAAFGARPPQHLWYLGGRSTLPGHPFHAFVGDRVAALDLTAWRTVVPRWLRVRAGAAVGWAALDRPALGPLAPAPADPDAPALEPWSPAATDGVKASVGLGVGVVDGLLRLDAALPLDGGRGALMLSIDPRLWSFL